MATIATNIDKYLRGTLFWRALVGLTVFVVIWEVGGGFHDYSWTGDQPLRWIGAVPPATAVFVEWYGLLGEWGYWSSWRDSFIRVFGGFFAAAALGIPYGLALASNNTIYGVLFPPFEMLRPIPPLAWVPASVIFWPTPELSIMFITFLGAFYIIVINVLGGARALDTRYFQAARSMGADGWNIFRRIILPGVLPSIFVGLAVGMGITWEVVVAAEMIAGGGGAGRGGGGLGFFVWNAYLGGSYEAIVVGMISIGIAGYVSSALIRKLGNVVTPWTRLR